MRPLVKVAICFSLLIGLKVKSQTPISLDNAYEKAFENNLNLKNGMLNIDYQDKIKRSYAVIDPLTISGEIGQLNSAYTDNKFSINQTIRLPGFYTNQKQVLVEEWKNAILSLDLQKSELQREIALLYNQLNYQDEKEKLLLKADSIYTYHYQRSELRTKKGESNILEKTTAESYRSLAEIDLANIKKDREITLYQFNYLLNDGIEYSNLRSDFYRMYLTNADINYEGNSIVVKQLEQQKTIESAKLKAEKAKLLPALNIEYNNTSMYGTGADDKFYDKSARFHAGMIGLEIPLFNGAQKSLIEGQKINQQIAENNFQYGSKSLKLQYATLFGEYQKLKYEVDYYKTKGLQNANTIMSTGNQLYYNREINFLDYSDLIRQSLEIENRLVDSQKLLNEQIIQLNNLMQQ